VIPFFMFGLRVFFNSPTQFHPKAGIEWCCSCDSFFVFGVLEYFSTVLPTPPKGIEWCAALVIPSFVFGLKSIFQQSYQFLPRKQGLSDAAPLWFPFIWCFRVFFNSPTQFPPIKQGLSDVLLFVIPFFVFGLKSISTVLPFPPYKAGIEWCAAFCDSFLCVWS
jgi:hypothetical protein